MVTSPLNIFEESFLVLDVAKDGASALFLSVDRDRNLTLERFDPRIDLKRFISSPFQKMLHASWEGNHVFKSRRRIALSADPSIATTIPVPLEFSRGPAARDRRITSFELEEAIAHAMVKIVPQCRAEAAARFKADLLNVVLVGAKAQYFVIDGKHAARPVGFVGDRISLVLELTLATRDIFEDFKDFFSSPEPFFFVESPQAILAAAARVRPMPVNLIAGRGGSEAGLYVLDAPKTGCPVLYREPFASLFEASFAEIAEAFSVSRAAAMDIYAMYCRNELSQDAARGLRPRIQPKAEMFFAEADKAKLRGTTYLDIPYLVPFAFPFKHGNTAFEEAPLAEMLAKVGLSLDVRTFSGPTSLLFRHIAPFVEMYFERHHSQLNDNIRRRLHWLAH